MNSMLTTQMVGFPVPGTGCQILHHIWIEKQWNHSLPAPHPQPVTPHLSIWPDHSQTVWMFWFNLCKVIYPIGPQQMRYSVLFQAIEQYHVPSEGRSGDPSCPDRMADIVVAVPERSFAILPCFPPMNGREPEEKCVPRKWGQEPIHLVCGKFSASLESMRFGRVMIEPRAQLKSLDPRQNHITFSWMQIPRRWITPQRPLRLPCFFPRRQRESELEKPGKGAHVDRQAGNCARLIDRIVRGRRGFFIRI